MGFFNNLGKMNAGAMTGIPGIGMPGAPAPPAPPGGMGAVGSAMMGMPGLNKLASGPTNAGTLGSMMTGIPGLNNAPRPVQNMLNPVRGIQSLLGGGNRIDQAGAEKMAAGGLSTQSGWGKPGSVAPPPGMMTQPQPPMQQAPPVQMNAQRNEQVNPGSTGGFSSQNMGNGGIMGGQGPRQQQAGPPPDDNMKRKMWKEKGQKWNGSGWGNA